MHDATLLAALNQRPLFGGLVDGTLFFLVAMACLLGLAGCAVLFLSHNAGSGRPFT